MAKVTEPQVFLIGETRLIDAGLQDYLDSVGAPDWDTDAPSDSEKLIEAYGRMCYRSFAPELNPNVSEVSQGNKQYLQRIIGHGHGSVLEHAFLNFIITGCSRVFTHELVRHRVGTAISQESLRYVRLDDLLYPLPPELELEAEGEWLVRNAFEQMEQAQVSLAEIFDIDNISDFDVKKKLTSAFRRIAPVGLATAIGWSANPRTIRHVLEMRTSPHAEWEIRKIFGMVGGIVTERYPNLFADYEMEEVDGLPVYTTRKRSGSSVIEV